MIQQSATASAAILQQPRNLWTRARVALELMQQGELELARRYLETIRYHPELQDGIFDIYDRQFDMHSKAAGDPHRLANYPADFLMLSDDKLRRPFRKIQADAKAPSPYPVNMALPRLLGAGNDTTFIENTAISLDGAPANRIRAVQVVITETSRADAEPLLAALKAQSFQGQITVTMFDATGDLQGLTLPGLELDIVGAAILDPAATPRLQQIANAGEMIVFLSGKVALDPYMIRRATHLVSVSDNVVQPVVATKDEAGRALTAFSKMPAKKLSRYPFRDLAGLNLVVSGPMLRRIGLPDPRFTSPYFAARELAFRMFRLGAYFKPLTVPGLAYKPIGATGEQEALYQQLCPNSWDRKADGVYETPSVSVYIPAYNASKYIERAIDSILNQDFQDLEVCVANDGSKDSTAELMDKLYANEPRVRWQNNANGGIGFASNLAITMGRAPYIGQLDSDDCLKPGAVRRLKDFMDENPTAACAYGSCERIDADGNYVMDEYSWPTFSREKMMITSIAHHFRMFRRSAWERTGYFREDIVNAVDYDLFLKLSEVGPMHHVDEVLYQRRWHGENTSSVNEVFQTANTYKVQRQALKRMGMDRFWDVHLPDPNEPRRVTYKRKPDTKVVLFWPDYTRSNPYQYLLYGKTRQDMEVCGGDIDAAMKTLEHVDAPGDVTFHLHWLNLILKDVTSPDEARTLVDAFLAKVEKFVWKGGRFVWTIHNTISHDSPFHDLEVELSNRLAKAATVLHFHSEASVSEVQEIFDIPRDKVRIARHGSYIGCYPDFVDRDGARAQLGLAPDDDVLLFTGQVRPYKGIEMLVEAFRAILPERPKAKLMVVGKMDETMWSAIAETLTDEERARIFTTHRFVEDMEMQLFFRAADVAVYPYHKILTSGSLLLALSFGVPTIIPEVGMTRETLEGRDAGLLYDNTGGSAALADTFRTMLARKDAGELGAVSQNARALAEELTWPDLGELFP